MSFSSLDEIIRIIHETLKLSRDGTFNDVTLICRDGQAQSNSIFLAAIFPVMRNIFQRSNIINEDLVVISLPDVSMRDVEDLFQAIYQLKESFLVSKDILDLLYFSDDVKFYNDETNQKLKNGDGEKSINEVDNNTKKEIKYRKRNSNIHVDLDNTHAKSENEDVVNDIKSDPDDVDNFIQMIDPIENDNWENETGVKYGEDRTKVKKKKLEEVRKPQYSAGDLQCRGECGDSSCSKTFTRLTGKRRHVRDKLNGPRSCHICGVTYSNKSSMDKHLQEHEGGWMGKTRCPKCHKVIQSKKIDEHMKVCEPKVKETIKVVCNLCGLSVNKNYLKEHIMYQHEVQEKKFLCDQCDAAFVNKHRLQSHMRNKHTEKLPCPHCGVKVRRLDIHISAKHTPDHEQKHQCQDCGKGFGELRQLKAHQMNVHLKLRPYNCRYGCDIAYNDTSNRNQHEKRQHGKLFVRYDSRGREIEENNS